VLVVKKFTCHDVLRFFHTGALRCVVAPRGTAMQCNATQRIRFECVDVLCRAQPCGAFIALAPGHRVSCV